MMQREKAKEEGKQLEQRLQIKTILVVEDDVNIGEVLVQAITQETSHLAVLAQSGVEALEIIKGIKPSLFILDYHLPRMTGIELYDQMHAMDMFASIPALMISARLPEQELKKRNILGMNKPLELDDFLQTIEQLVS